MILKLVRDLMNMAFKIEKDYYDGQRLPDPRSDHEVSKEDDGVGLSQCLHLDCGDTKHGRLPQCSPCHQVLAQTVDKWDTEELTARPTLPTQSKVSSPGKSLIFLAWKLKTDAVLVPLLPVPWRPQEPGMAV